MPVGACSVHLDLLSYHVCVELGNQFGLPVMHDLPPMDGRAAFTDKVPIQFLKKYLMVPLVINVQEAKNDGKRPPEEKDLEAALTPHSKYVIAMNDPSSFQPLDDLVRTLGLKEYDVVLSTKEAILSAINISYDLSQGTAEELVQGLEEDGSNIISELENTADLLDDTSDAPIIKLVNHILSQSIKARASDIHIQPYQDSFKVRYRIDGILYDLLAPPKWIQPALISRIKVMAKLNIAEKRLPQDGAFKLRVQGREIDFRVSVIPSAFGEGVVIEHDRPFDEVLSASLRAIEDAEPGQPVFQPLGDQSDLVRVHVAQELGLQLVAQFAEDFTFLVDLDLLPGRIPDKKAPARCERNTGDRERRADRAVAGRRVRAG